MKNLSLAGTALLTLAAIGLSGCGGGGGGDGGTASGGGFVAGTEVPVAAEQNVGDVIAFAKRQIAATSESSEPVSIGNAKLATSESDDPADI